MLIKASGITSIASYSPALQGCFEIVNLAFIANFNLVQEKKEESEQGDLENKTISCSCAN